MDWRRWKRVPRQHVNTGDTIAAISSCVGVAARMIVRVSGGEAIAIAGKLGVEEAAGGSARRCALGFAGV